MEVPVSLLQDMVAYVEKSNEILEKAASQETEVSQRAPAVVDSLIKAGLLNADQRNSALQRIQDPLKALESLRKTAEVLVSRVEAQNPGSLGLGESVKSASTSVSSTNVGKKKESDIAFEKAFGLQS